MCGSWSRLGSSCWKLPASGFPVRAISGAPFGTLAGKRRRASWSEFEVWCWLARWGTTASVIRCSWQRWALENCEFKIRCSEERAGEEWVAVFFRLPWLAWDSGTGFIHAGMQSTLHSKKRVFIADIAWQCSIRWEPYDLIVKSVVKQT